MNNYPTDSLLNINEVNTIIRVFEKENVEIRLVGGCIRNAILNKDNREIDCAVNKEPNIIINVLKNNNIKFKDLAKKYGSIVAFINNKKFEITSLRKDINQQGRHTEILYTNNWSEDAARRDFTINAIYLTSDGKLIDYFQGLKDLEENKIKFIGDVEKRITEDFLRIFRYYRFLGIFEKPKLIEHYENILNKNLLNTFHHLSKDLIRNEILKMLNNPYPLNSFCNLSNPSKKNYWLEMTTKHFLEHKYQLGLEKCLNKVEALF